MSSASSVLLLSVAASMAAPAVASKLGYPDISEPAHPDSKEWKGYKCHVCHSVHELLHRELTKIRNLPDLKDKPEKMKGLRQLADSAHLCDRHTHKMGLKRHKNTMSIGPEWGREGDMYMGGDIDGIETAPWMQELYAEQCQQTIQKHETFRARKHFDGGEPMHYECEECKGTDHPTGGGKKREPRDERKDEEDYMKRTGRNMKQGFVTTLDDENAPDL